MVHRKLQKKLFLIKRVPNYGTTSANLPHHPQLTKHHRKWKLVVILMHQLPLATSQSRAENSLPGPDNDSGLAPPLLPPLENSD